MRIVPAALLFACLGAAGCASLPQHVAKSRSEALMIPADTTIGRAVEASGGSRDLSGIRLLSSGEESLASLIALADRAERTLDIQYYIIHQDESARLLFRHVGAAADRGVRVRVLVDDLNTTGEDRRLLKLGQRPNIEVRLFNPFAGGRLALWTRFLFSALDISRINHRMHNKLFVADNALAITGGRNIGDQYFMRDKTSNFIDLDVIAAGSVVPRLSASFDAFWNSQYAYPVASLAQPAGSAPQSRAPDESLISDGAEWLPRELDSGSLQLQWVPATVLADRPAKIASDTGSDAVETVADSIAALMRSATQEVIVISAYFVPGEDGMQLMRELVDRGVRIRILTNSLASTDSPLVHNGYSRYRVPLLELGVELREVRPKLGQKRPRFHPFQGSAASLHAKALVIDQKTVFIGSLNMDSRSKRTNSELGLIMRSGDIARQVTNLLDDISAEGSYHLSLTGPGKHLEWRSGEPGAEQIWHKDPETTLLQRFWLKLLAPFAPEELL